MKIRSILLAIAAMVVGYHVIVALTILGFNVWLDGADLYRSGPVILAKGTLVSVVAGLAGGFTAAMINRRHPLLSAALVLIPLAGDTAWVLFARPLTAPFWFEAMGSLTLMAFTIVGGVLFHLARRRPAELTKA